MCRSSLPLYLTLVFCVSLVSGWRVVFKVGQGKADFPGSSVYDFWTSNHVLNDDRSGYMTTQETYSQMDYPSYKSDIINTWKSHNIKMAKVGMYEKGKEVAFVMFNATYMNNTSWFSSKKIVHSSFSDLTVNKPDMCSMAGEDVRTFMISSNYNASCEMIKGWMMVIDAQAGNCHWEYGYAIPFFRYASTELAAFSNTSVAEAFAVFVDDCVENPCKYGGQCHHITTGGYTCSCVDQTYGQKCEITCPCHRGRCKVVGPNDQVTSGGVFVNGTFINNKTVELEDKTVIACKCNTGYEGTLCENSVDDCASSPCQNGGFCIDGDNEYVCDCPTGFSGTHCAEIDDPEADQMAIGAKVAIGICVPLAIILVAVIVGYGIYIYKNPERFGRSTTYKQYVMARDFVRRSFRRLSGRKTRPPRKLSEDTKERDEKHVSPKEKETGLDHVNLGFQDNELPLGKSTGTGSKTPVYSRENSEYFELSANDEAVVAGPDKYDKLNRGNDKSTGYPYHRNDEKSPKMEPAPQLRDQRDYDGGFTNQTPEYTRSPRSYEGGYRYQGHGTNRFDNPYPPATAAPREYSNPPEPHYNTGYVNEPHRNPSRPSYDRYGDEPPKYNRRENQPNAYGNTRHPSENSSASQDDYGRDRYRYDGGYDESYDFRNRQQSTSSAQDTIVFASTDTMDEVTV